MSHWQRIVLRSFAVTVFMASSWVFPASSSAQILTYTCGLDSPPAVEEPADACCQAHFSPANCPFGGARLSPRKNIVFFVSDDNGFCHHGFMQGMCSESSLTTCEPTGPGCSNGEWCLRKRCVKPCLSNAGCDELHAPVGNPPVRSGVCMSSSQFTDARGSSVPVPLRVTDLACRHRWPIKTPPLYDTSGPFPFSFERTNYPAYDPPNRQLAKDYDAHVITPHLDALASQAAVFPRAHVGGMSCKPARTILWNGIFNRHLASNANPDPLLPPYGWGFLEDTTGVHCPFVDHAQAYDPDDLYRGVGCYLHGLTPTGGPQYHTYLIGKEDITNPFGGPAPDFDDERSGGNSNVGNIIWEAAHGTFGCTDHPEADCANKLAKGETPYINKELPFAGLQDGLFKRIEDWLDADLPNGTFRPTFVWYSPNVPHFGASSSPVFLAWYPNLDPATHTFGDVNRDVDPDLQTLFGRISMFDAGVGAVMDGLKRRCVCSADGKPTSLYDQTIFVYINDNGNILPDSKRRPSENGERSPILISEPAHRLPVGNPDLHIAAAVRQDYAGGVDLLGTFVSYAQQLDAPTTVPPGPDDCGDTSVPDQSSFSFNYPYDRNLCRVVRGAAAPLARTVYPTHLADEPRESTDGVRMVLTAPGELGVCMSGSTPDMVDLPDPLEDHVQLCRKGQNGQCPTGHVCTADKRRCIDNPGKLCVEDKDCAETSWCLTGPSCSPPACPPEGVCRSTPGACTLTGKACTNPSRYKGEFWCHPCNNSGDCVPVGTCQLPILKFIRSKTPDPNVVKEELFDTNWDPDQKHDLLVANSSYAGLTTDPQSLRNELKDCIEGFWTLTRNHVPGPPPNDTWNTPSPACVFNADPQGP
jgi:arylsulfatase A-like enzyme